MRLLVKCGRLLDPSTGADYAAHIAIENGKILAVRELKGIRAPGAPEFPDSWADEVINAERLTATPGFIDIHVHLREPGQEYKETIASGARAAIYGGFSTIVCMPNTTPVNDCPDITRFILERAAEAGMAKVIPAAAITRGLAGRELTDMEALAAAGAGAFTDDGKCVMDPALFGQALEISRRLGLPVMEHPEDHSLSGDAGLNEGVVSRQYGLPGIPAASEDNIVARDIELQAKTGGRLHLTHLSTAGAAEWVAKARHRGQTVTADVTPHHLLLTEEAIARDKHGVYKMKPPLRTENDRQAMIRAVQDGIVDCIATDHAPHAPHEKDREFERAAFGVIGMETAFPVLYDRLVRAHRISLPRLVELMAVQPARIMNLRDRGSIQPGFAADITFLDLEKPFKIDAAAFQSRSVNCPFIGWEGRGVVAGVMVSGRAVYRNGF